jgi:hypothetical protein
LEAENSIICKKRGIINRNHAIAKYFHLGLVSNFRKGGGDETVCGRSVGGVYGIRVAGYWGTEREKSKALKEVVKGDERFKQRWPELADRFKDARHGRAPTPGEIVSRIKSG